MGIEQPTDLSWIDPLKTYKCSVYQTACMPDYFDDPDRDSVPITIWFNATGQQIIDTYATGNVGTCYATPPLLNVVGVRWIFLTITEL